MRARCEICAAECLSAEYNFGSGADESSIVWLDRDCEQHGTRRTLVSSDPSFFERALLATSENNEPATRGLVVELLDGCQLRCATCSASSSPDLLGLTSPETLRQHLRLLGPLPAVLLSGGEPTLHPLLGKFMSIVEESGSRRRILITNGVRLAEDASFAREISERAAGWEVFLQFDSLNPLSLLDLRAQDLTDIRRRALAALSAYSIPTTLVCVVKRSVNDGELADVLRFAAEKDVVVGVQFQPIRATGRVENYTAAAHGSDLSMVRNAISTQVVNADLRPHPRFPLSVAQGWFARDGSGWRTPETSAWPDQDFYSETPQRTVVGGPNIRVTILEYADLENWTSLRSAQCPLIMLDTAGTISILDDHFAPVMAPDVHG